MEEPSSIQKLSKNNNSSVNILVSSHWVLSIYEVFSKVKFKHTQTCRWRRNTLRLQSSNFVSRKPTSPERGWRGTWAGTG